ncbi:MAG: DUF3810 domain-containing protein [Butyrivibrio sp.]|nr:DUF3810 domain-containing protein [Muribaculum sp.]MCM1553290.1 DUF3810 domain-containing protein [Butyrivibrio sp.]
MLSWIKTHKAVVSYMGIAGLAVLLNLLAWCSTAFCDAYIAKIFPIWVNTYGRLTGLVPWSVGEWLLIAGILLAAGAVVLGLPSVWRKLRGHSFFAKKYLIFCAWVLVVVCLVMTLNCFMLYHASTFSEKYMGGAEREYSVEELLQVRNMVAEQCNRLSGEVVRDEQGYIVYSGSVSAEGAEIDMLDKAREEMRALGEEYAQLQGYYPRPKPIFFSDFMCQQYMLGWYFPFSMEANYNYVAYVMNQPSSLCHELAHLKGFIYEDEANFISYLACVRSEDIYFQYSGYLSVLGYLERDMRAAAEQSPNAFAAACEAQELVELLDIVYLDDVFVTDEEWERIEGKALLDTETVDNATDIFVDSTLKANGVADGKISYHRVVSLLLEYYAADAPLQFTP